MNDRQTFDSQMQINNSQLSSIRPEETNIDEEALEKFYEERQSFVLDSIEKREKEKAKPPTQKNKRLTPRPKTNFAAISNHKNIIPSNIITYEAFKEGDKTSNKKQAADDPMRSQSMRSLRNQLNTNDRTSSNKQSPNANGNSKHIEDIFVSSSNNNTLLKNKNTNAILKNNINEQAKYEFNSFRKNNQIQVKETPNRIANNSNISHNNSKEAIAITDQNNRYHQQQQVNANSNSNNILKTEARPHHNNTTLNLFNRSINLKSEIAQNGFKNPQPSSMIKPIRPMTPILSNIHNIVSTNTSVNIKTSDNKNNNTNIDIQPDNKSIMSNPTYANEMHSIISKRKAILTISTPQSKTREEQFIDFYNRNIDYWQATKAKANTIRNQLTKDELDQCSFNPKLSQSTEKILNDSINYKSYHTENDFYQKNINWKKNRDKEIQHQSVLHDKERFEECYFHPTLNKELHETILKEVKGQKPDYIYKKNIKWLAQVNENKKKGQLEQIEQRRLEQEQIRLQNQKLLELGNQLRSNQSSMEILNQLAQPKYPIKEHHHYRSQSAKKSSGSYNESNQRKERGKGKEEYKIGKDINEIKGLISSLKDTLNENRKMNVNYNRDMIVIDQSCNVNIVK